MPRLGGGAGFYHWPLKNISCNFLMRCDHQRVFLCSYKRQYSYVFRLVGFYGGAAVFVLPTMEAGTKRPSLESTGSSLQDPRALTGGAGVNMP